MTSWHRFHKEELSTAYDFLYHSQTVVQGNALGYSAPVQIGEQRHGYVFLAKSLDDLNQAISRSRNSTLAAGLLLLLISLVVVLGIAAWA